MLSTTNQLTGIFLWKTECLLFRREASTALVWLDFSCKIVILALSEREREDSTKMCVISEITDQLGAGLLFPGDNDNNS